MPQKPNYGTSFMALGSNPFVTLFSQCIHPFDVSSRRCYGRKS